MLVFDIRSKMLTWPEKISLPATYVGKMVGETYSPPKFRVMQDS